MFRKSLYATLIVMVSICGCVTTDVSIKPALDFPERTTQIQRTIGVYQSPEFLDYESTVKPYRLPVGQASASLFQELFPKAFKKVVWVESIKPISTEEPQLSAVIEPQIEAFQLYTFVVGRIFKVWTEIDYVFTVYSPEGVVLDSWSVKGSGESAGSLAISRAVNYAMEEAAWRFITSFNNIPEAKRWSQGLPQKGAIADESTQTTRPIPEFAKDAVVGVYPGIVAVRADTNPTFGGQSVELSTRLKELGLHAIRIEIKNQGNHRLLIRRRDITIADPDGSKISSLPASIFATLGVKPRMKGFTAPSGVGVGSLPMVFTSLVNLAAYEAERKELETLLLTYQNKEIYDATLTMGKSVQGYTYFFIPEEVTDLEDLKLVVPIIDFDSATRYIIRLPLNFPDLNGS